MPTLSGANLQRNWTVAAYNTSSVTFSLYDPDGFQGFPGAVVGRLVSRLVILADGFSKTT